MKISKIPMILLALALSDLTTPSFAAEGDAGAKAPRVARGSDHALAVAYHKSLTAFARALQGQTDDGAAVNVDFARKAVAEMRRNFDQMKMHHSESSKAMSADEQARMKDALSGIDSDVAQMNARLADLEKEVAVAAPDPAKVSKLAASMVVHWGRPAKRHGKRAQN